MKVEWKPVKELFTLQRRSVAPEPDAEYQEIGVRSFGKGLFIKEPVSGLDLGNKRVFQIDDGDLIVSNVFAWEGAVGLAGPDHDGLIGSHRFMTWTSIDPRISARYVLEFFRSKSGVEELAKASPGSAGRNRTLSIKNFEEILVPVPSRPDQARIAAHLDSLARRASPSPLDATAVLARLVLKASKGTPRQAIGALLARDREWITLDPQETYRPVGIRGFGNGIILYPPTDAQGLSKMRYFTLTPGDLLVSNIKAWEGAVCVAGPGVAGRVASNRFLQYRPIPTEPNLVAWLAQYLLSDEGLAAIGGASPGSVDRNRTSAWMRSKRLKYRYLCVRRKTTSQEWPPGPER